MRSVGDVNGDGIDDFLVTAPAADDYSTSNIDRGGAYLIFGRTGGFDNKVYMNDYQNFGIRMFGTEAYEHLGGVIHYTANGWGGAGWSISQSISGIGDINGDGFNDFIIGSPGHGDGVADGIAPGRAYVVYGRASGWTDIDFANMGGNGFILSPDASMGTDPLLGLATGGGGDFNGDGYDDFLVTAAGANGNKGAVYLVFGQAGGFTGNINIETLVTQGKALKWTGSASNVYMGINVGTGDWNGDGLMDVAISEWRADSNGQTQAGSFKIYYGNVAGVKGPAGTPPVVLDLNRDGEIGYGHVVMDVTGDGVAERTAWADANDGVLVWDRHGDGQVRDNSQYAFVQYGGATDLEGLAAGFDSNGDGVFDASDDLFHQFAVWQDVNQNGVSDAGEVVSLADWGIVSIDLTSDGVIRPMAEGVTEFGRSTVTMSDGSKMVLADVLFDYTTTPSGTDAQICNMEAVYNAPADDGFDAAAMPYSTAQSDLETMLAGNQLVA